MEQNKVETFKVSKDAIHRMAYYINERYTIMRKREQRKPAPWSDDEIFHRYSFTNLDRDEDKDTRFVYHKIKKIESRKWRAIASFTMRFLQDMNGFEERFKDIFYELFNEDTFKDKAWELEENHFWFRLNKNNWRTELNYKTGNTKRTDLFSILMKMYFELDEKEFNELKTVQEVQDKLRSIKGVGPFLSTQIVLDLRMIEDDLRVQHIHYHDKGTKWGTWWLIYNTDHKFIELAKKDYPLVVNHKKVNWEDIKGQLLYMVGMYMMNNQEFKKAGEYLADIVMKDNYNWNNILCEYQKYSYIDYWYNRDGIFVKTTAYRKLGRYGNKA